MKMIFRLFRTIVATCLCLQCPAWLYSQERPTQSSDRMMPATLVEASVYEPCDYNCGPLNHPTAEYCISVGNEILVGERPGFLWFGEKDKDALRNLAGQPVVARSSESSIWISKQGYRTLKIHRGSSFEQFKDPRCLLQVHKAKMELAAKASRPPNIPLNAFPLAGEQDGDYRPAFVWFSCAMNGRVNIIDCQKWYPKGGSRGVEHYCGTTVDGNPVPANFEIDRMKSREGMIVLTSGVPLQFDHRGRVNDELQRPSEKCY